MADVMATWLLLALMAYGLLARPAERRIHSRAVEARADQREPRARGGYGIWPSLELAKARRST
jgi:hypothetical protein